jgi:NAD+ synthase
MNNELSENLLKINPELVTEILCRFVQAEIRRAGFQRAVVGLSGGIDSSVVTFLCARALGPQNVLAVTMPYKTSSEATRRDSQMVIEQLGVRTVDVPIAGQIDAYFSQFPDGIIVGGARGTEEVVEKDPTELGTLSRQPAPSPYAAQLRLANKCARERMTVLYDQSAAFSALVAGTSNKSELLLGYGTQFGDMASAINPIGDLYKTQLYGLAAHLGVPAQIITKEPTGDLWVGQTDAGELGFSYAEVDRLLVLLVDRRWRRSELLQAGFAAEFVDRVTTMIRRNHYKRRMPVIAKLSHRTMDRDFRYARDWGT